MKTVNPSPRKRSTLSKILIGIIAVVVACCGLSVIGAIVSPSRPTTPTPVTAALVANTQATTAPAQTPTQVSATSRPTSTPEPSNTPAPTNTPSPTNTPAPTNTPDAEALAKAYRASLSDIGNRMVKNMQDFSRLSADVSKTPTLLANTEWKLKMAVVLATMRLNAKDFRELIPPPELEEVDVLVEQMADKIESASHSFAEGIDELDVEKFAAGTQDLNAATELTGEITKRLSQ